jgi:hypothetical protein
MRNASRRSARTPLDEEPRRTSFICVCCGQEVVAAIEGLFYNHPVGPERRFCSTVTERGEYPRSLGVSHSIRPTGCCQA